MKHLFLILEKRILLICLSIIFLITFIFICFNIKTVAFKPEYTIVVDAGHGGIDGGAVGESGISESQLNLDYAIELKKLCESVGIKVVMTRSDMNGLYSPMATNKKRSEMEKREKIINSSGADAVVSIHMNSFPLPSSKGAQVFYKDDDEVGKVFADSVQNELVENIENSRKTTCVGDYYVLNCCQIPAILVECGYLSNKEEENLLCNNLYKESFCKVLLQGILKFFNM